MIISVDITLWLFTHELQTSDDERQSHEQQF